MKIILINNRARTSYELITSSIDKITNYLVKVGNGDTWSGIVASGAFKEFSKLIQKFPAFEESVKS